MVDNAFSSPFLIPDPVEVGNQEWGCESSEVQDPTAKTANSVPVDMAAFHNDDDKTATPVPEDVAALTSFGPIFPDS